jgi:hypothetical protein
MPYQTILLTLIVDVTESTANYIILKVNSCEINTQPLYSIQGGEFVQQLTVKFS